MTMYLELKEGVYDEILEMLEKVYKFEAKQYDLGMPNRFKDIKATLEEFKNSVK